MYTLLINDTNNLVSIKCSDCDKVTPHSFKEAQPIETDADGVPLTKGLQARVEEAQLIRNLNMCTVCGKLSLKK